MRRKPFRVSCEALGQITSTYCNAVTAQSMLASPVDAIEVVPIQGQWPSLQ